MSTSRSDEKEQQRFWNEFRIGVLAVVAIALLFLGVRFLQGVPLLGNTYALVAQFESADGVMEGTPVVVRGISVGTVEEVELSDEGGVRVRMQIQEDVQLTEGTTASITGLAALDDVSVSLHRAPGGAPLASGARIPTVERGMLKQFREQALPIAQRVDSVLAEASGTFSEARRVLGGSKEEVNGLLANLQSTSANVEAFVHSERDRLRRVLGHLEQTSASLEKLVADLRHVTASNRDTLEQAVQDAELTFRHTRRAAKSLRRSAKDLEHILGGLRKGRGTAGQLLNDPTLYRRLNSISLRIDSLLADFQQRPGHYLETSVEIF